MSPRTRVAILIMAVIVALNVFRPSILVYPQLGETFFLAQTAIEHGISFLIAATIAGYIARCSILSLTFGLWFVYWMVSVVLLLTLRPGSGGDGILEFLALNAAGIMLTGIASVAGAKSGLWIYNHRIGQSGAN